MSRIISVLDAFDAMTHRRHDQPALTTEEALQELHRNAVGINQLPRKDRPNDLCKQLQYPQHYDFCIHLRH